MKTQVLLALFGASKAVKLVSETKDNELFNKIINLADNDCGEDGLGECISKDDLAQVNDDDLAQESDDDELAECNECDDSNDLAEDSDDDLAECNECDKEDLNLAEVLGESSKNSLAQSEAEQKYLSSVGRYASVRYTQNVLKYFIKFTMLRIQNYNQSHGVQMTRWKQVVAKRYAIKKANWFASKAGFAIATKVQNRFGRKYINSAKASQYAKRYGILYARKASRFFAGKFVRLEHRNIMKLKQLGNLGMSPQDVEIGMMSLKDNTGRVHPAALQLKAYAKIHAKKYVKKYTKKYTTGMRQCGGRSYGRRSYGRRSYGRRSYGRRSYGRRSYGRRSYGRRW